MQPESGLLMSSLTAHILLSKVVRLDTSNMLPFVETILSYSAPNITPYHRGHVIVFTFVARLQNWQVKLLRVHLCFLFQSQATKFMWWHFDQQDRDYRTLEDPPTPLCTTESFLTEILRTQFQGSPEASLLSTKKIRVKLRVLVRFISRPELQSFRSLSDRWALQGGAVFRNVELWFSPAAVLLPGVDQLLSEPAG